MLLNKFKLFSFSKSTLIRSSVCLLIYNNYHYSLFNNNKFKSNILIVLIKGKLLPKDNKITTELLINKFKKIHGNNFDYSKVEFDSLTSKVVIICPDHGEFYQQPRLHLRGSNGCKTCIQLRKKRK